MQEGSLRVGDQVPALRRARSGEVAVADDRGGRLGHLRAVRGHPDQGHLFSGVSPPPPSGGGASFTAVEAVRIGGWRLSRLTDTAAPHLNSLLAGAALGAP